MLNTLFNLIDVSRDKNENLNLPFFVSMQYGFTVLTVRYKLFNLFTYSDELVVIFGVNIQYIPTKEPFYESA